MRVRSTVLLLPLALFWLGNGLSANEAVDRAHRYEDAGDSAAAREIYSKALQANPNDPELLTGYAQVLERYKNPGARDAYRKSATLWKNAGRTQDALRSARRAVLLDLIAGDRVSAEADLATYSALGGTDLQFPGPAAAGIQKQSIPIPGPIRSFARMAALSPDIQPDDILAALARNVVTNGYQASHSNEEMEETEYLKLVQRYLSQARELDALAGADKVIRIETCESTQTNDLLRTLGYRMRGACGSEVVLETVNAARAFITTDSGFPLADLEAALRTDKPFSYDYHPSRATVLFTPDYWLSAREKTQGDFIDSFLRDPGLCRSYLGMAKLDPETAEALKNSISPVRLRGVASVLDFFGGNFEIRQGKAIVPGGAKSAGAWGDLAGVSPDKGAEFFEKLMIKDDGWLASLYDALARIHGPVEEYLTDPARMKRYYSAVRGRVTTPGPARPVFQSNTDMMLLTTRLRVDSNGRVHIPGDLDVWRDLFQRNPRGKYDAKLSKAVVNWKDADDIVEALFALCRKPVDNEPMKIFMALSDLDRNRPQPLKPETVQRLIHGSLVYGAQYVIFNDAPLLSDRTIVAWLDNAEALDKIRDSVLRSDAIGMVQGLTGIWQIFCRQGSIPADKADETLLAVVTPFSTPSGTVRNSRDLFDAGRVGVNALLKSAGASGGGAASRTAAEQDRMLALLAGGPRMDDSESRTELVQQEQRIFEAQKLLPVDLLFDMADNLQAVSKGEKLNAQLSARLAARVADIELPRSSMSGVEKSAMAFGYYVDKHIDDERKVNLRAIIDKAAKDPQKLTDIRGQLAPALRDTLVGYNYLHYAPPGAQILITNPLFVRGHDFLGIAGANHSWRTTEVYGTGWPSNAGGRLVGSLSGLPYALAEAEQNFLVPTQTQALIWGDLVPQMMLTARASRFWTVTPSQMHWVGMHMRFAEELIAEAALEPAERDEVSRAVYRVASPSRASLIMASVGAGDAHGAIEALTPSEMYSIADGIVQTKDSSADPEMGEILHLRSLVPDQVSEAAISRAWGTPKPTLANSYHQELLNLRTFPTLMGYSSRIMAESWESNLLYWADVGDQMGVQPAQLNVMVPEWTEKAVERIFASHLEDWPALLRSVRSVGEELRVQSTKAAVNSERAGN
jgi:hypothetical protein